MDGRLLLFLLSLLFLDLLAITQVRSLERVRGIFWRPWLSLLGDVNVAIELNYVNALVDEVLRLYELIESLRTFIFLLIAHNLLIVIL